MKTIQLFIFLFLATTAFGQTKADFVNCLDLIFAEPAFQPAFNNHQSTRGNVVILSPGSTPQERRMGRNDFQNSLTSDDFRFSDHYVKILRPDEFETEGIPLEAALQLFASGKENELSIILESLIWNENQRYSWSYRLVKEGEEWEIVGSNLSKQKAVMSNW